jgi:hypothetical protein
VTARGQRAAGGSAVGGSAVRSNVADSRSDASTLVRTIRRGLLALTGIGLLGTTIELVFLRHWSNATATIVWVGIIALGLAFVTLLRRPSRNAVRLVRIAAAIALVVSAVGVFFHVRENLTAAPLDRKVGATWDSLSPVVQLWMAGTGGVGPAPTLAPGSLAEIALGLLLATIGWSVAEEPTDQT